jgi:hypothetical protein
MKRPITSRKIVLALNFALIVKALVPQVHAQGGVPLWTNRYDGPASSDDEAIALVVGGSGNVFAVGQSSSSNAFDYATIKYSGAGTPLWTNRYRGSANGSAFARGMAVDDKETVFVTGYSYAGSSANYATIAYSSSGVPVWTNLYNGPVIGDNLANAVAVDGNGNVFVTGGSFGGGSSYDYATIRYSGAGVPIWTNRYNGPWNGYDEASALAVDVGGNVFVTGSSYGSGGYNADYATIAYSSAGVPLWTNRYNGPGNSDDYAHAVAVDGSGNVFVTGYSYGGDGSGYDYATIKYSPAGVPLWTNRYNGPGNGSDRAWAMAVDKSGKVFVTGDSVFGYGYDCATVAYSNDGVAIWTNRYVGPGDNYDGGFGVAVDAAGNVFVTGKSYGTDSRMDYVTIAYSNAGIGLWTNRYNGSGNGDDGGNAVAVDSSGNVFVIGNTTGSGNGYDYTTLKYSSSILAFLDIQRVNNSVVLQWPNANFGLQSAPTVNGSFTNIPGAASPYTSPITGAQQFFRLKGN